MEHRIEDWKLERRAKGGHYSVVFMYAGKRVRFDTRCRYDSQATRIAGEIVSDLNQALQTTTEAEKYLYWVLGNHQGPEPTTTPIPNREAERVLREYRAALALSGSNRAPSDPPCLAVQEREIFFPRQHYLHDLAAGIAAIEGVQRLLKSMRRDPRVGLDEAKAILVEERRQAQ